MTTSKFAVSSAHLSPIDLLGTRVEGTFTAQEAMEKGRLGGWNVRAWPAAAIGPDGEIAYKPGMYDIVRDNPDVPGQVDVLTRSSVSGRFEIFQNEEHAEFLNTLVDESGAHFEIAGSIDDGRKVLLSMKLPGHILIGGVDKVETSIIAINAHDGSTPLSLAPTPVRFACSNVFNISFGGRPNTIRARHTSGMRENLVSRARKALDLSFAYLEEFQEEAERLVNTPFPVATFEQIVEREFGPQPDMSKAAATRAENRVDDIMALYADADTQAGVRGTAWAGLNALVEWHDHYLPTRGANRDVKRATRALLDPSFKQHALELISQG